MYRRHFKRLFDLAATSFLLLSTSPLFIITWIILFIQNRGMVFFRQQRPGLNGNAFFILKFKTMNDQRDDEGNLLPDIKRITSAGKLIRKLSLDELPQLLNVLKGEMSLVGPRPLLFKYIKLYSPEQNRRHEVLPGITGWAQVNGRNSISWQEKFLYDVYYVDHVSLCLDIKILWFTFLKVLKREGINQSADRPMQPFNGSN
jgi:undecaprenyl phosphate N,N'-diacetylbacillosamine 1-phosphate transferase